MGHLWITLFSVFFLLVGHLLHALNDPEFEHPHRGCYYTNWAQYRKYPGRFTVADVDSSLCTYIVVAFGKIENNSLTTLEWNDEETFRKLVALRDDSRPSLKILLSIGGWTLSNQLIAVSKTKQSRTAFAASVVRNLRYWELDGLDVDWEYPDAALKEQYSALLLVLREAFEVEAKERSIPRLALAAAVHFTSDGGYDGKVLDQTLDLVNVMSYDLHGAWDREKVGHHAPLFRGPFGQVSGQSVSAVVKAWEHLGVSKNKLVVGLPMYGRGWILGNSTSRGLGAAATDPIGTSNYTGENGAWPFYEICQRVKAERATYVFDKDIQSAYAYTPEWWIGYDDRITIAAKVKWTMTSGYGGVYVWDLAQDDFHNSCGMGHYPLLNVIRDVLNPNFNSRRLLQTTPKTTQTTLTTTAATTPELEEQRPVWVDVQETSLRQQWTSSTTRARPLAFPLGGALTGKPFLPKPSVGKLACDKSFCQWNGPGSFAIGRCEIKYCDCDAGNNPYSRECIGGLVYDTLSKFCNWQENVEGCPRFSPSKSEA
ncbi:hypothetical protein RvY_15006 [Ramazzottius varieornatus]|uniref:Uncharacterized protein n=1 Tax=Ramazzottius varieornatus TaxID=947166 RepID=A0A1D1VTD2_RAMVA|nr:hypothetical protein RvY_15006 [Ramazzottius varieornatus]